MVYHGSRTDTTAAKLYDAFRERAQCATTGTGSSTAGGEANKIEGSRLQHSRAGSPSLDQLRDGLRMRGLSGDHEAPANYGYNFVDTERPCMLHPVKVSRHRVTTGKTEYTQT